MGAQRRALSAECINHGRMANIPVGERRVCIFYELVEQQHNHVLDIHKKCIKKIYKSESRSAKQSAANEQWGEIG